MTEVDFVVFQPKIKQTR